MNSKLNEKIKSQISKKTKFEANIRTSHLTDSVVYNGKVGLVVIDLNSDIINDSMKINSQQTIRLYRLFNNIVAKLFSKHRNYMTMRSNSFNLIGLINSAETIDYNLCFELMTMLNSFRQEWNESLKDHNIKTWEINLSLEIVDNTFITENIKEGLTIFKKDETHLENELILMNWMPKKLKFNPESFYISSNFIDFLKDKYQQMCVHSSEDFKTSEAKASFTDKFEW